MASIVALEVAQYLQSRGYEVEICTGYIASPLLEYIKQLDIPFQTLDNPQDPSAFDVIWSQSHILPAMLYKLDVDLSSKVNVFSVALSPYDGLELPCAISELSTRVLANSRETANALIKKGISSRKIKVFNNAAPSSFSQTRLEILPLKSILAVANHAPPELEGAIALLENQGIIVNKIGFWGQETLVTPQMIAAHDAVITIGKTVQYSLLSQIPVYIYDRFGGPGWLGEDNFNRARDFNFSGRCCNRKLLSNTIADEIVSGYTQAMTSIRTLKTLYAEEFLLDRLLGELLNLSPPCKIFRKSLNNLVKREGALALQAAQNYGELQRHMIEVHALKNQIADI